MFSFYFGIGRGYPRIRPRNRRPRSRPGDGKAIAAAGREEVERGLNKFEGKYARTFAATDAPIGGGPHDGTGAGAAPVRDPQASAAAHARIQVLGRLERAHQIPMDILALRLLASWEALLVALVLVQIRSTHRRANCSSRTTGPG